LRCSSGIKNSTTGTDKLIKMLDSNKLKTMIKNNFANGIVTCDLCKTCGFLKRLEEKRKS
jgi:hypothetical protein